MRYDKTVRDIARKLCKHPMLWEQSRTFTHGMATPKECGLDFRWDDRATAFVVWMIARHFAWYSTIDWQAKRKQVSTWRIRRVDSETWRKRTARLSRDTLLWVHGLDDVYGFDMFDAVDREVAADKLAELGDERGAVLMKTGTNRG